MTTLADRLPTAHAQAVSTGLCRALFIQMVEATTIDWTRRQVWVQDQDNTRRGIEETKRALVTEDVPRYFGLPDAYSRQRMHHVRLMILSDQGPPFCRLIGSVVDFTRHFDHHSPREARTNYISFDYMKIVLYRVLEENKPRPALEPIPTSPKPHPIQIVRKENSDPHADQSGYLLPSRPPSPHSIRSVNTVASIVSDVRTFTAKSFDTFLVPNEPPHDPRQTPFWSIPREPLCSEPVQPGESAFFPHVAVQLPPDSSPRWDARRRALERLNDGVKFPVKDVARYTLIPPSPGQGGNWRWREVEQDPWKNRRQHRKSSLSSGLDGIWRFSHKWRQWRKGRAEGEQMQTGAQNATVLEDPFKDSTGPPSPLIPKPVMNINKPLPPTPISVRTSLARRLSAIRTWRPRRPRVVTCSSESPPTSPSSTFSLVPVWTDEDSIGYEHQQHAEDEDSLGRLLADDWVAAGVSAIAGSRSPGAKKKAKLADSGVYLYPLRAMECS
ncbi:hypothetical protein M407DRAFT_224568 [Tulasnella calospora MUT 4182]|uniref:Uncharacterized protein n=1 Tax=Tulasnella calospora MUT 4182 TaxID=1051891 RepID=A0A0C3PVA9_9AGAM|nr:hypothetical protein M407DRAFT_224568 [Tulasnella calospora MUT 4182]